MKSGSAANDDRDSSPSWTLRPSPRRGPSPFQSHPVGVILQLGAGAGAGAGAGQAQYSALAD